MNSASCRFIRNADSLQPFAMVKKTHLRQDASELWGLQGFEIERFVLNFSQRLEHHKIRSAA